MKTLIDIDFLQLLATVFLGFIGIVFTTLQVHGPATKYARTLREVGHARALSISSLSPGMSGRDLTGGKDETVIRWLGGDFFDETVDEIKQKNS